MSELKTERQLIKKALEDLKIASFVYEHDAGARPVTIEEAYINELKGSDLYIGIFWKKYGEYTIDEYNKAKEFGKPRLIYRKEHESSLRDQKLQQFLETIGAVNGEVAPCFFHDGEELPERIQEDVMRLLTEVFRSGSGLPASTQDDSIEPTQLPCLCDRVPQERQLQMGVDHHVKTKTTRPVLILLEGQRQDGHRLYVTRLEMGSLLDAMAMAGRKGKQKIIILPDPLTDTSSVQALSEDVGMMLAGKLRVRYTADHQFVLDYVKNEQIKTFVTVLTITSEDYTSMLSEPLMKLYDVLASYPDLPDDVLIGTLVCIQLDGNEQAFKKDLKACQDLHTQKQKVHFLQLPSLKTITKGDMTRWLALPEVKSHLPSVGPPEIDELFSGNGELRMEELFGKLQGLISKAGRA